MFLNGGDSRILSRKESRLIFALLMLILVIGMSIRFVGFFGKSLWYDEVSSVAYAPLNIPDLIQSVGGDPHPPFYYLQLHYWMLVGANADWVRLNSWLFSILTIPSIFYICRKIFSLRVGFLAAGLLAIAPFAVRYAQEARMYSLIMFLGLWIFFFAHRLINSNSKWVAFFGLLGTTLAFLYSQGAAGLILVSLFTFFFLNLISRRIQARQVLIIFGSALLIISILYLPWLLRTPEVSVGHTIVPDLNDIVETFAILLLGFSADFPGWLRLGFAFVVASIVIYEIIVMKPARALLLSFVVSPILAAIIISHLYRPIWLFRTIAFTHPFICIAFGLMIDHLLSQDSWRNFQVRSLGWILVFTITGVFIAGIYLQLAFSYPWNFRDAGKYIRENALVGQVIYIPNEKVYWGMAYYLAGPGVAIPNRKNYQIITDQGVELLMLPEEIKGNAGVGHLSNYWLIYRDVDNIDPFVPSDHPDQDFDHLFVDYFRD